MSTVLPYTTALLNYHSTDVQKTALLLLIFCILHDSAANQVLHFMF